MHKEHVQLTTADRAALEALVSKGTASVRTMKRALGLLSLDQGATLTAVGQHQQVTIQTVGHWRDGYVRKGLACLADAARSGRPVELDGQQRAKVTALACSAPPPGYSRWNLRLLADKAVELDYCEALSHTSVGQILKKTNSSPIGSAPGSSAN
jgi:transposase